MVTIALFWFESQIINEYCYKICFVWLRRLYRPAQVTSLLFPNPASRTAESGRDGHSQAIQPGTDSFLNQLPRTCNQREFYFCVIRVQVMSSDFEEQEDELLALQSIFSPQEFDRNESKVGGEIRVSVDVPAGFIVATKEGKLKLKLRNLFLFVENKPMVELDSDFHWFHFKALYYKQFSTLNVKIMEKITWDLD